MEAEGADDGVETRVSLHDRCINAYSEARAAVKSVLALGQGESLPSLPCSPSLPALSVRLAALAAAAADPCTRPTLPPSTAVHPPTCAGGADSEALRNELLALDRAVQGLGLEKTIEASSSRCREG